MIATSHKKGQKHHHVELLWFVLEPATDGFQPLLDRGVNTYLYVWIGMYAGQGGGGGWTGRGRGYQCCSLIQWTDRLMD